MRLFVTLILSVYFLFKCASVCWQATFLSHAESLDVSGQFNCDSDEQCSGDGLSVIWLTEQWWIIPGVLSPPRHAANDFCWSVVMICDSCCFGQWAHFLSDFWLFSYSNALMCGQRALVDDMRRLRLDSEPLQRIFFLSPTPQIVLFSSHIHLIILVPPAIFVCLSFTLPWPCLICSFHFLYLSVPSSTCLFSSHLHWPFFAPRFFFHFLFLYLLSSLFSTPPSLTHNCLFVYSLSLPSVLIPLLSLALIFPISLCLSSSCLPPPLFIFSLSITSIHFSYYWSTHPSFHLSNCLTLYHFVLPSVIQEKPPSCCMTFCILNPLRSSWCPAAAVSPHWWPKLPACGTS